jgi:hypothetical protein
VVFLEPRMPTPDLAADLLALQSLFRPEMAYRPENYGVRPGSM